MNEKFFSQKIEKQNTMINGAMQVFAYNGYHRASTDEMSRVSGVSNGLWFYYFESLPGLYNYVANYALKYAAMELSMPAMRGGMDYFELRYEIESRKMNMRAKYPYLPLFLYSISREEDPDVLPFLREPRHTYDEEIRQLHLKADISMLKKFSDYLLIIDMLDYTMEALLVDGYRAEEFQPGIYLGEVRRHMDVLRALLEDRSGHE